MRAGGSQAGSAVVELVWLAVLWMIPLVYVVLTAVAVQRAEFGVTQATQGAARAYATAGSDDAGERRAELAAALAFRDQGIIWSATRRVVACGGCGYAPGSEYTVEVVDRVRLPLVPSWLCGHGCPAGIVIKASHTGRLGCFSGLGPPGPAATC
jgi:hypothetical protein